MLQSQILKLAKALSPAAAAPSGWDSDLPKHAELDLGGATLVVARCGSRYVLSVVAQDAVRSVVASGELADSDVADAAAALDAAADRSAGGAPARNSGQRASPSSGVQGGARNTEPLAGSTRDPNAPPGFEDEHLLSRPPPSGPRIAFDPDRDLNPPGGAHPQLRAFDPLARGDGAGMVPAPFGSSKPPNIREDPTFPFGARPGAGPGPGRGPFDQSPFGPGPF